MNSTQLQSTTRLILYVLIAMVTTAAGGILSVDFTNPKQIAVYALSVLASGLVTARSYIDKTPAQVDPPSSQP